MSISRIRLIVNADDLGFSHAVNRGVRMAHSIGIVTSASLMVRQDASTDAIQLARDVPTLDVGIHLDIGEWAYQDGEWQALYEVVDIGDSAAMREEFARQVSSFIEALGRKPTHIDTHQHVHLREPVKGEVLRLGAHVGAPVRHFTSEVSYCGDFYGQTVDGVPIDNALTVEALVSLIRRLGPGITEMSCHPADAHRSGESSPPTMYDRERQTELATLCDSRVRSALEDSDVELASFADARGFGSLGVSK